MLTKSPPRAAWVARVRRRTIIFPLLVAFLALGMSPTFSTAAGAAPPCPEPPPPQDCGGLPCLPSTGGGYCADHPDDPDCGAAGAHWLPARTAKVETTRGGRHPIATLRTPLMGAVSGIMLAAAPPCDGPPAPPPPPIPVCAVCEAPGVAASVELPTVRVRMNPDTGLVNLPTWFWAEGYRGQDLVASRSWSPPYEPTTIEVRYSVKRYLWNFGDGGQIESKSLGQPYPAASEIANAYAWSSRTEPGGVFHPGLTIEWNVEYRVNGGAPQPLPPVSRPYPAIYPVQELQPIVTGP